MAHLAPGGARIVRQLTGAPGADGAAGRITLRRAVAKVRGAPRARAPVALAAGGAGTCGRGRLASGGDAAATIMRMVNARLPKSARLREVFSEALCLRPRLRKSSLFEIKPHDARLALMMADLVRVSTIRRACSSRKRIVVAVIVHDPRSPAPRATRRSRHVLVTRSPLSAPTNIGSLKETVAPFPSSSFVHVQRRRLAHISMSRL